MEEVGVKLILEGQGGFMSGLGDANAAVDKFAGQANVSAQSAAGGFSALEQVAIGSLRRLGEAAVNAGAQAAQAIAGFVGQSIGAASQFEGGMNEFAAATGGALEAAGMDIKDFESLFLEMGQKLPVSTAEVQAAALALAKGGLDPAVIAAGGLENSLNFASAAGMGLADAAELGVKMLGTFTSITDDTATKTAFLASSQDLLVKAANASTLNIDALGDAMLAAGGQAKAMGLDYQDFVTTMGLISPAFGSAAEAGTSFKNLLVRLQPSTQPAKDAFAELGLSTFNAQKAMQFLAEQGITPVSTSIMDVEDALLGYMEANQMTQAAQEKMWAQFDTSVFFDAQGAFIGMEAASQRLQDAFIGLSDADRVRYMQQIFGNDAMGAANALVDGGSEAYRAFAEQMLAANGVAAQSAAVQQGLDFQMTNFQGSVEALQISLGTMLIPALTTLFETVLTPGINTVLGFVQALGGNETALAALSPMLQGAVTILQTLGSALMEAGPFSLEFAEALGMVHPALQPLMLGLGQVISFLQNNWQTAVTVAGGVLAAVLAPAMIAGATAFGALLVAAAPVIAILAGVGVAAALLKSVWDQNLGGVQEKTAAVMAAIQGVISSVLATVLTFWQNNGAQIMAFAQTAWGQVQAIIGDVLAIVLTIVTRVFASIQRFLTEHGSEIQATLTFAWNTIQNVIQLALNTIQGIVTTVLGIVTGDWETASSGIQTIVGGLGTYVTDQFNAILKLIEGLAPGFLSSAIELAGNLISGLVEGITNGAQQVISSLTALASDALNAAKNLLGISSPSKEFADQVGLPIAQGIAAGILEGMGDVGDALETLGEEALKQFEDIAGKMAKLMDESLSGKVGLFRGASAGIDIISDLKAQQQKIEAARKKLPPYDPNMTDEQRTEMNRLGNASIGVDNRMAYAQQQLDEATNQATEIGKIDARAGADFLSKRQAQIKEQLKLQQALTEAEGDEAKNRARMQLDLITRAQEVEIQQLKNSLAKRANELGAMGEGYNETGNAIVDGMIRGMQERSKEMADALKNVLMFALRGAQESLGIKSPSLVFAQSVGLPIVEGIAEGIAGSAGLAMGAVGDLANSLVRPAAPALAKGGMGSSSVTNNFNYTPSYNGAPRQPTQDFAAMKVFATAR